MENTIKVMLADDKEKYRQVIGNILKLFNIEVIGEAGDGKALLKLLKERQPQIILLDLEMPVMDGKEAFNVLCKEYPNIKVIIISFYYESVLIDNYIERGAKGYIPKDALSPDILRTAIQKAMAGGVFVYEKPSGKRQFTPRQQDIMSLIFEGLTNDEIAEQERITKRSVEKQRHRIYIKSGAEKVIDFYKYAFSKGLQFLGKHKKTRRSLG